MKRFIILEIGDSAYTEFRMKGGEFETTQDAILIDSIDANSKEEALEKLYLNLNHKDKDFDRLMICEVANTQYV
ncbi:MAG: hypothetical protein LAT82_04630 [Nanoarchaeota archaeon]|nr:hypothetical protein [Nanoarchaeota archaeon]